MIARNIDKYFSLNCRLFPSDNNAFAWCFFIADTLDINQNTKFLNKLVDYYISVVLQSFPAIP